MHDEIAKKSCFAICFLGILEHLELIRPPFKKHFLKKISIRDLAKIGKILNEAKKRDFIWTFCFQVFHNV